MNSVILRSFVGTILRLAFLGIFFLFSTTTAHAFKVGFFVLEPHAMLVEGQPGGAAVEYLRDHIAVEMKESVTFFGPFPFTRLLHDFNDAKFDAILLLAKNSEREKSYVYPVNAYGYMESGLIVKKGFKFDEITSSKDLEGVVIGYANKAWRAPFMHDPSLEFDMITSVYATDNNIDKFSANRLGAVYNPDIHALQYSLKKREGKIIPYKLLRIPGPSVGYYTVFHPSVPLETVHRYEKALERVQAVCPYKSVVSKYLGQ